MVNDNSKKVKLLRILLGILLLILISLYFDDQSQNDYHPTPSVADLNDRFDVYQKQHQAMVDAQERANDNWHQAFVDS